MPVLVLILLFIWFYGRFVSKLYFVMDDYIEMWKYVERPLLDVIGDCFFGRLSWSGYRPLAYAVRAAMAHLFGMQHVAGYHIVGLGLHLTNTLLFFALLCYLVKSTLWAFVGAALFLLLPSHNEAVLYADLNANLIALFFGLVTTSLVIYLPNRLHWWGLVLTWLAYSLSVLAYEVMLPLPLFILLLELIDRRRSARRDRLILYIGFLVVASLMLVMRYFAMNGALVPARPDYRVTVSLPHFLRNYILLSGQMLLLHTSPWPGGPLLSNLREWLPLTNPATPVAMVLVIVATLMVLFSKYKESISAGWGRLAALLGWGIAWFLVISLPFVSLSGRNPENRYVYIPSLGFVVAVVASLIILQRLLYRASILQYAPLLASLVILVIYARVGISDSHAWVRAGQHARIFLTQAKTLLPELPPNSHVIQLGVPGIVGAAYVFTTQESFNSAMQMLYNDRTITAEAGDDRLSALVENDPGKARVTYVLVYDYETRSTRIVDWVEACWIGTCTFYPLATAPDISAELAFHDQARFSGGISYGGYRVDSVYRSSKRAVAPALVICCRTQRIGQPDYTLFVHLTDATGSILAQADHQLRQSLPYSYGQPTFSGWPSHTPICDVVALPMEPDSIGQTIAIRGGLRLPEEGHSLEIEGHTETQTIDESGRMVIGPLRYDFTTLHPESQ